MIGKLTSVVPEAIDKIAASNYIDRAYPMLGKHRISALIKGRQLKINDVRAGEDILLHGGDGVTLYVDGGYDQTLKQIYCDGNLLVIAKPAGLPVDRDADGIGEDSVLTRARKIYPSAMLCHRLDAGTSGVMLLALNAETLDKISDLFKSHLLNKTYRATVIGVMPQKRAELRAYLKKDAVRSKVFIYDEKRADALEIVTSYEVKRVYDLKGVRLSELNINIPTGRTHQIRAHLSYIGHPLLGDDKYGDREINKKLNVTRCDLCCREIAFPNTPNAGAYAGRRFTYYEDNKNG